MIVRPFFFTDDGIAILSVVRGQLSVASKGVGDVAVLAEGMAFAAFPDIAVVAWDLARRSRKGGLG
jgi:hypothetical protein